MVQDLATTGNSWTLLPMVLCSIWHARV